MTSKANEQVAVSINGGGNAEKLGDTTSKPATTFGKLYTRLEEALEEHSPGGIHPEDMKKLGILVPMTILYIFVFLGALLYFAIQGAYAIQGQQFLSANKQDGSICATVASYITAIFEADLNGVWSTDSANFQTNSSFYSIGFTGGAVDEAAFTKSMQSFQSRLIAAGAKASVRDVTYTLLIMSTLLWRFPETGIKFSTNADPDMAFGSSVPWSWAIINHAGRCVPQNQTAINGTTISSFYDKIGKNLVFRINGISVDSTDSTLYTEPCPKQLPSLYHLLGYRSDKYGSMYDIKFDIRTVMDVVAINLGIYPKEDFNLLNIGMSPSVFGLPDGSFYIDSFYKNFQPFFCLSDAAKGNKGPDICFLALTGIKISDYDLGDILSYTLFYPTLTSYGEFPTHPPEQGPCQCPRDKDSPSCNIPDHLLTLFYDTGDPTMSSANNTNTVAIGKYFQQFLVNDPDNGDLALNKVTYIFSYVGTLLWYDGTVFDAQLAQAFNALCPNKKCAAMVMELTKASAFTPLTEQQLNLYGLTSQFVKNSTSGLNTSQPLLMCSDLVSQQNAVSKLVNVPPVQLTMPFFNCHNTLSTALQTSIGIAQGYASLASQLCITVVTILIVQFFNRVKAKSPEEKLASAKAVAIVKQRALEQSVAAVAQNQQAMAPLLLEIVASSKDNRERIEERYASFQYNHKQPKMAPDQLPIAPDDYVKEQKETISNFRSTGRVPVEKPRKKLGLKKKLGQRDGMSGAESSVYSDSDSDSDSDVVFRLDFLDDEGRVTTTSQKQRLEQRALDAGLKARAANQNPEERCGMTVWEPLQMGLNMVQPWQGTAGIAANDPIPPAKDKSARGARGTGSPPQAGRTTVNGQRK